MSKPKKKNSIKPIVIVSLFLLGLILILNIGSQILRKRTEISYSLDEYYALSKDINFDQLVIGSSHVFRGIDPEILDNNLGTQTYNLATSAQVISQSYYTLVEALKHSKPKTVFLDSYFIYQPSLLEDREYFAYEHLATMPMSFNKLNYMTSVFGPLNYVNALFPMVREHENWQNEELIDKNITYLKSGVSPYTYVKRGYVAGYTSLTAENKEGYQQLTPLSVDYNVSHKAYNYVKKIVNLCKKNDIRLILVNTPIPKVVQDKINEEDLYEVTSTLAKELDIEYVDFNTLYNELDFQDQDFLEEMNPIMNHHVNRDGAKKVTDYLIAYVLDSK